MTDYCSLKLGKRAQRKDVHTLKLARYLTAALPPAPAKVDWTRGTTDFGMMLNDQLGCCTIAAIGHAVQTWTANAIGRELTVPDSTILNYYEKWDGYNPKDPSTDQGGVELDVLNNWRKDGFQQAELDAYAAVNPLNAAMIAQGIWLCGGAYIGIELPIRAQEQDVWDVPANPGADDEPGSWGGHAVYLVGYDKRAAGSQISNLKSEMASPSLTCITWGKPKRMTWAWFEKYCSEAYALVSKEWLTSTGIAPSGFDLATLEQDLAAVTA